MKRASAAALATVMALSISACNADDGEPAGVTTDTPTATPGETAEPTTEPTTEAPPDEPDADPTSDEAVLQDYAAAMEANIAAYDPPDPESADLLARWDGNALQRIQGELDTLKAEGNSEVVAYEPDARIHLLDPSGVVAVVRDCYTAEIRTVDTATGDHVGSPLNVEHRADVTLELRDDVWVVVNQNITEGAC